MVFRVHLTLLSRYAGVFDGDLISNAIFDKVELSPSHLGAGATCMLELNVPRTCEFEHFLRAIYEHRCVSTSKIFSVEGWCDAAWLIPRRPGTLPVPLPWTWMRYWGC